MKASEFINEAAIGTNPKRPAREGTRPPRGHDPEARYTPSPAKPFRNPPGFNKQGTGLGNKLAQQTRAEVAKEKQSGVAEGADQVKKVFKDESGKPVGEIGIDGEASPGNGEWYVHHYATGYSVVGFDSAAEAKRELRYVHNHPDSVDGHPSTKEQGVAESVARMEAELAELSEHGKASRELCKSSKPDADLGASMLSSCKSQGLRARDGDKSHKLGKTAKSRVKVGGHRIKGRKYGGPLPDWS